MKKYRIVAVHRDSGRERDFDQVEAPTKRAAIRAAKTEIRRGGELGVFYKYKAEELP